MGSNHGHTTDVQLVFPISLQTFYIQLIEVKFDCDKPGKKVFLKALASRHTICNHRHKADPYLIFPNYCTKMLNQVMSSEFLQYKQQRQSVKI